MKFLGLLFVCSYFFTISRALANSPRVIFVDPKKRYLIIDKPPGSTEFRKGARVCLHSRANFFLSCSAVVVSNRTKAALVLSKLDMERVKVGMPAEVKEIFIKKDDPVKGSEFVTITDEQNELAQNKKDFQKLLEQGKKASSSFLQDIEDALKGTASENELQNSSMEESTVNDSGDGLSQSRKKNPGKHKMSRANQDLLKKAIDRLTGGASLDELQNAGWLAGLKKEEPLKPISKKELSTMQKDMGANFLKTGDRELLAMDMWDKPTPMPIEMPPPANETPKAEDKLEDPLVDEVSLPIESPKDESPFSIDPLAQIQKIFVLPPPKPQKKAVRFDVFTIFQPKAPASAQALGFKKLEQTDLERQQLWQQKDAINSASASFGLQMVMTRAYKHIYYLGYRTTFFQKKQTKTDYDANDYTFYANSETKFSASGSWFDYGRKIPLTAFLYTVGKVGLDLDSSIADFKSLRGNDVSEDHYLIAYGNSKLTLVSLRLGLDLGFHYWGFGFVSGINTLIPFYTARRDFNGGVSVPENITFVGDPLNDLKKSLNHRASSFGAEVYLGFSYEPY